MIRKSSHTVTYTDMVKWLQRQVGYAQERKAAAVGKGINNLEALTRDEECAKMAARIFKRFDPVQQTNLFEIFKSIDHGK